MALHLTLFKEFVCNNVSQHDNATLTGDWSSPLSLEARDPLEDFEALLPRFFCRLAASA